jgi:hypothetical protein
MPTPADIAVWMEPRVTRMKNRVNLEDGAEQQLRERREYIDRASRQRPTYDEMKARYGPNWGILAGQVHAGFSKPTLEQVRERYGAEKVDAVPDAANGGWKKLKSNYGAVR